MTVLLIRANRNEVDEAALEAAGLDALIDPYLEVSQVDNSAGALRLLDSITSGEAAWLVVTSLNALDYWSAQLPPGALAEAVASRPNLGVAAIGPSTAAATTTAIGVTDVLTPGEGTSRVLADLLADYSPGVVVVPSGAISMRSLPETLIPRGFEVREEVFYSTQQPASPPRTAGVLDDFSITDVLFRSPSAVRSFAAFNPELPSDLRLFATGPTTAEQMRKLGLPVTAVSADSSPDTVAQTIASTLQESS